MEFGKGLKHGRRVWFLHPNVYKLAASCARGEKGTPSLASQGSSWHDVGPSSTKSARLEATRWRQPNLYSVSKQK